MEDTVTVVSTDQIEGKQITDVMEVVFGTSSLQFGPSVADPIEQALRVLKANASIQKANAVIGVRVVVSPPDNITTTGVVLLYGTAVTVE